MKRLFAILSALMLLTGALTGCSGSVGMDDGRAYGNISTMPNGTAGGRNRSTYTNRAGYGSVYGNTITSGTGMSGGR